MQRIQIYIYIYPGKGFGGLLYFFPGLGPGAGPGRPETGVPPPGLGVSAISGATFAEESSYDHLFDHIIAPRSTFASILTPT